jgi:hypothetical protein
MPTAEQSQAINRLKATARDLVALISGADGSALRAAPAPGEWSPATVVSHLADAELVYLVRLKLVVAEDRPTLTAFDENRWSERFASLDADAKEALGRWRTLREATLRLIESFEDAEWERTGHHVERGTLSTQGMVELLAAHDRNHLDQIRHALA